MSGLDTINYFSGSLNIRLPLLTVKGRGDAGFTMMLPLISQRFQVYYEPDVTSYFIDPTFWYGIYPDYSPGVMAQRIAFSTPCPSQVTGTWPTVQSRLQFTFIDPDGTEHEFYDTTSNGALLDFYCGKYSLSASSRAVRGRVFESSDGDVPRINSRIGLTSSLHDVPSPEIEERV